ncbi:uncharacterized protein AB675_6934 [Cyphellophora attinorum]|uniref:Uncharacterized protein n=1 Tax=Cyphellophora attinorum TaxID=1664694 RepID=A0A0N1HES7_9EURO|nr:uncharacterized protein AB675_6934 [Phialophora attinorum]KPI43595.1 hypothetical protein AB675_6934 [Phialophora attinorum]
MAAYLSLLGVPSASAPKNTRTTSRFQLHCSNSTSLELNHPTIINRKDGLFRLLPLAELLPSEENSGKQTKNPSDSWSNIITTKISASDTINYEISASGTIACKIFAAQLTNTLKLRRVIRNAVEPELERLYSGDVVYAESTYTEPPCVDTELSYTDTELQHADAELQCADTDFISRSAWSGGTTNTQQQDFSVAAGIAACQRLHLQG